MVCGITPNRSAIKGRALHNPAHRTAYLAFLGTTNYELDISRASHTRVAGFWLDGICPKWHSSPSFLISLLPQSTVRSSKREKKMTWRVRENASQPLGPPKSVKDAQKLDDIRRCRNSIPLDMMKSPLL